MKDTTTHVLRVRIDSSRSDSEVVFTERLSRDFFDLASDDELSPQSDILVFGKAYCASEWIMVQALVTTLVCLPCSICDERCLLPIQLKQWEQSIPISSVKNGVIDLSESLREDLLLEVPNFIQCGGDTCKHADELRSYFRAEGTTLADDGEEKNQPFLSLL